MLKLVEITKENLKFSLGIFHRVFRWLPDNVDPYSPAIEEGETAVNYLVYDEGEVVGLSGFYVVPADPESAWLGWFGVLPEMRRNHYGSKIVALYEESIKKAGYKYSRLYTERNNNDATRSFYERCGYSAEDYDHPKEPSFLKGLITTYSKSLGDWPLVPWNCRYLGIAEEEKKMYSPEQAADAEKWVKIVTKAAHE